MRGALSGRGLRRRRLRYILLLPVSVSACLPGRAGIERILITQRLIGRLGLRACGRRRARARADTGLPNLAQFGAIGPGQGTLASPGLLLTCPHTICPRASARLLFACKRRLCLRASAAFVCVQAPPLFACKRRLCLRASARRGWQHRSQNLLFSLFALSPPGKVVGSVAPPATQST